MGRGTNPWIHRAARRRRSRPEREPRPGSAAMSTAVQVGGLTTCAALPAALVGERAARSLVVYPRIWRPLCREWGAARPHHMRPRLADSAGRRSATNREQRCAALGAVALPAGTTIGQGHLPRVGDGDLLPADASALWLGFRCLWLSCARFNHGPGSIFPADWLSRGRCRSTRADLRSERPLARLVGGLGLVRSSGSCHEMVTSVGAAERMRSVSRISSLAAIACRIVDDRGFKAPGQSWCSVARVLAVPRGWPRARFTSRVNATTIALIRFVTNDLCRRYRGRGGRSRADRRGGS
jgi:hypothetical protein